MQRNLNLTQSLVLLILTDLASFFLAVVMKALMSVICLGILMAKRNPIQRENSRWITQPSAAGTGILCVAKRQMEQRSPGQKLILLGHLAMSSSLFISAQTHHCKKNLKISPLVTLNRLKNLCCHVTRSIRLLLPYIPKHL